jgi:glutaredoxin 3
MAKITVYTTEPCSFCTRAKQLLTTRELSFDEVNLSKDPEGRAALSQLTGMMSFPQVIIGTETVGGFMELVAADRSGLLGELTADAA